MASDLVAVIKWIRENASFLGIDTNKICIHGCSGGGYAVSATCSVLALADESHLVKLAMLDEFCTPAWFFKNKKEDAPNKFHKNPYFDTPAIAEAYAHDFDK